MKEKLVKLYNAMSSISTKGESTKIMSDCLRYLEILIDDKENEAISNMTNKTGGD